MIKYPHRNKTKNIIMFEINSKPKKISIQVRVKSGDWLTVSKIDAYRRYFSFEEIAFLLDVYESMYGENVRVLNEYSKVILSSASYNFCRHLENANVITTHWIDDDKKNVTTYSVPFNSLLPSIRDFQRLVARNGGIKKWKQYSLEKKDDYTLCGKLTFRNGRVMTVAIY